MADDALMNLKMIGAQSLAAARAQTLQNSQQHAQALATGLHGARSAQQHQAEVTKAATQFEAMLVQEMLKSMWSTVPQNGLISGSREEEMFRDMFNEGLANQISEGPGLGIKDVVIREITRAEKKASQLK
ncbi:MAG: rod-binding protein [Oligoflexia bacterium]|nr:rod-binding protein [Oligoflexia bacterium]